MALISVLDHRNGLIPNRLTAPFFVGLGLFQVLFAVIVVRSVLDGPVWWLRLLFIVLAFTITFGLWTLHFIGGGDAKFLMALFALFPAMEWVVLLALLLLVLTLPLLLWEMRHRRPGEIWRSFRDRLLTGQFLPSEADLHERGRRYAWTFGVPAMIYTWAYWDGIAPYVDQFERFLQGVV